MADRHFPTAGLSLSQTVTPRPRPSRRAQQIQEYVVPSGAYSQYFERRRSDRLDRGRREKLVRGNIHGGCQHELSALSGGWGIPFQRSIRREPV